MSIDDAKGQFVVDGLNTLLYLRHTIINSMQGCMNITWKETFHDMLRLVDFSSKYVTPAKYVKISDPFTSIVATVGETLDLSSRIESIVPSNSTDTVVISPQEGDWDQFFDEANSDVRAGILKVKDNINFGGGDYATSAIIVRSLSGSVNQRIMLIIRETTRERPAFESFYINDYHNYFGYNYDADGNDVVLPGAQVTLDANTTSIYPYEASCELEITTSDPNCVIIDGTHIEIKDYEGRDTSVPVSVTFTHTQTGLSQSWNFIVKKITTTTTPPIVGES